VVAFADDTATETKEPVLANVNFFKADLVTILQQLAAEAGYNLIATPEVTGTITIQLTQVSFEDVLKIVCRTRGLIYLKEGHNFFVGVKAQSFVDQKIVGYFHINYADPNQMMELIKKVVGNQDVYCDDRTRTIVISSSKDVIDKTSSLIESIDRKMPQITIEVKLIEVSTTALHRLANRWQVDQSSWNMASTSSGADLILGLIGSGHTWNLIFNDLVGNDNAHLLTSPSISTLDGKEASILIGQKVPVVTTTTTTTTNTVSTYNMNYLDVGVKLNFTPRVQKDNELIIDLKTQISSLGDMDPKGYYTINSREVNSIIQAKIGQTVFLGGLITKNDQDNLRKVPVLSNIPLIGKLFQSSDKSNEDNELIITITPKWNETINISNTNETK
jgi:type II secretory pathway component GspD/PulD (secretin)